MSLKQNENMIFGNAKSSNGLPGMHFLPSWLKGMVEGEGLDFNYAKVFDDPLAKIRPSPMTFHL